MINLSDYEQPFDIIEEFEDALAKYTGAEHVVLTDGCSHAIELCFRYLQRDGDMFNITIPNRTYLSVPMVFKILGIPFNIVNDEWSGEYNFGFSNVWDSARKLIPNMYRSGQMQCLSFGLTKPLEIGRGGAILLDNAEAYSWLKRASYDGRDLSVSPWQNQEQFQVGYHYMIRPEECVIGLNKINNGEITDNYNHNYPDLSRIIIK